MSKDLREKLRIGPGRRVHLRDHDPRAHAGLAGKEEAKEALAELAAEIGTLQTRLHAESKLALLVILQGMDTSGKDGAVKAVFSGTNSLGLTVTAFSRPTREEMAHDFLWRIHRACPRRGAIGVFNRSQYEDVLVGKVRRLVDPEVIEHRYNQINAFEDMIASSTRVLKFMLHISKEEQKERLQARLDDPSKHWKFDPADLEDRACWDDFQDAYESMLARCSTETAPWYVVPADHKWVRNTVVATIVRDTLRDMDPRFPPATFDPTAIRIV